MIVYFFTFCPVLNILGGHKDGGVFICRSQAVTTSNPCIRQEEKAWDGESDYSSSSMHLSGLANKLQCNFCNSCNIVHFSTFWCNCLQFLRSASNFERNLEFVDEQLLICHGNTCRLIKGEKGTCRTVARVKLIPDKSCIDIGFDLLVISLY